MEIVAVVDVFALSWIKIVFQCPEVVLSVLLLVLSGKRVFHGMHDTFFVFLVDGLSCCFGQTLSVNVLACNLRNISCVSWDVLSFDILGWSSNPIFSLSRMITILDLIKLKILSWWVNKVISLLVRWFANSNVNIVSRWLLLFTRK